MQCKWSLIVIYLCLVRSFLFWQHSPQRASISKTQQFYSVSETSLEHFQVCWSCIPVPYYIQSYITLVKEILWFLSCTWLFMNGPCHCQVRSVVRTGEWAVPSIKNFFLVNYVCWVVHYRYLICVQFFHPLFTIFPFVCALFNNIRSNLYSGPENQENSWSISTGCCLWFIHFLTCFNFAS